MNLAKKLLSLLLVCAIVMPGYMGFAAETADEAYVNLVAENAASLGMTAAIADSSAPSVVEREGRYGWALGADETTGTINCNLDRAFANNVSDGSIFEIEVDYYDSDKGVFSLVYSAQDRPNRWAGMQMTNVGAKSVRNTDVKAWRTKRFYLYDAKFNDDLDGCDFKISANAVNSNHDITSDTDSGFGTKYSWFYPSRYGRVSTVDEIVIGAIRVKKLSEKNPLSLKLSTANYGNIFFDDEDIKIETEIVNNFDSAYELSASYSIIDEYENETEVYSDKLSIAANESKTVTAVLKNVPYGCFKLRASYTTDGIQSEKITEISRCREAKVANPRVGTNIHLEGSDQYKNDYDAILTLAKKAGYSSMRDSIRWFDNEKSAGTYTLRATTAKEIEKFKEYGMDLLPVHNSSNTPVYGEATTPLKTTEMLNTYQEFCTWLTKELDGVSEAVEAHNEYNLHNPTATSEDYANMMKALYNGTKKVSPNTKIIGIDTGGLDLGLMRRWFEAGALEYMDVVSYHPYDWARSFEDGSQLLGAASVRSLMDEFGGGDKELWVTETGWHEGLNNIITSDDKAYYLPRAILQNDALKVFDRVYFYEFVDGGMEPSYGESSYGTLNSVYNDVPYGAQKAYISAANVNWLLGEAEFDRAVGGEPSLDTDAYIYRYNRDNKDGKGGQMIALWTKKAAMEYGLELGVDTATMIDFYGNESEICGIDGKFSFCLTDRPVYLIGDFPEFNECEPPIKQNKFSANGTVNDLISVELTVPRLQEAEIKAVNNSDFEADKAEPSNDGKLIYTVKTPDIPFYNKSILFEVTQDGNLYYMGKVVVKHSNVLTVTESHMLCDRNSLNRWQMIIEVTNNKNVDIIDASIVMNKPDILSKHISSIGIDKLQPGETREYVIFLPEIITKEMRDFSIDVKVSGGETYNISHNLFFTTVPYAQTKPIIDGKASDGEYNEGAWFDIKAGKNGENYECLTNTVSHSGDSDLSGKATASYDEDNIYFFIEITDDVFVNNHTGADIWNGDSVQIGIADEGVSSGGSYCELTVALTSEGAQMYRHGSNNSANPIGPVENCDMQIIRSENKIYYELAIPWSEVLANAEAVKPGYKPRFAFLINEDDGQGRNSYMEYSQVLGAIGTHKNVAYFSDMYLAEK